MDTFLDMLTIAPAKPVAVKPAAPKPAKPAKPVAPFQPDYTLELDAMELPKVNARPHFADDIDRMVRELEHAGDIVLDTTIDAYRRPHYRRYRWL